MRRGALLVVAVLATALAVVLGACTEQPAPSTERPSSLRVPLPDGWKALAAAGGLQVGPPGRAVLQLESNTRALPTVTELVAAVEREKVVVTNKEVTETFIGVSYRLPVGKPGEATEEGFLGVRKVGPKTVWCASVRGLTADEATEVLGVCRGLSWDVAVEEKN